MSLRSHGAATTRTPSARQVLTPDALAMLQTAARVGSFAGAARELGLVPSALTYRVRQIEEALDVLLFDRSARQARLTAAGAELLHQGERLLQEIDAIAHRVRRVATGWEPQLTIAVDTVIDRDTVLELVEAFQALNPPTRLRLRDEALSGTLQALISGRADLAIGVVPETASVAGIRSKPLGVIAFVYAVSPRHPLARAAEPISDEVLMKHRAVAVADSNPSGPTVTFGLLGGQDVLTVSSMQAKLEAQVRGLGSGFLPESWARAALQQGHLVERHVERSHREARSSYAWRATQPGRALQWWLHQLEQPRTRAALMDRGSVKRARQGAGRVESGKAIDASPSRRTAQRLSISKNADRKR